VNVKSCAADHHAFAGTVGRKSRQGRQRYEIAARLLLESRLVITLGIKKMPT
jgi:hypothetical protein